MVLPQSANRDLRSEPIDKFSSLRNKENGKLIIIYEEIAKKGGITLPWRFTGEFPPHKDVAAMLVLLPLTWQQ